MQNEIFSKPIIELEVVESGSTDGGWKGLNNELACCQKYILGRSETAFSWIDSLGLSCELFLVFSEIYRHPLITMFLLHICPEEQALN